MFFFTVLEQYLWWHYQAALVGYIRVSRNFWWYFFHIFSIPQLTSTLFAPYKRITEPTYRHFSFKHFFERLFLNFLSRLVGAFIRITILLSGLTVIIAYTTISLMGFALWLGAPPLILFSFITGIWLLFI